MSAVSEVAVSGPLTSDTVEAGPDTAATACTHEPKRFSMVAGDTRRSGQAA